MKKILSVFCSLLLTTCAHPLPAQEQYRAHIQREAQMRFGLNPPVTIIAAQIQQESGWNPRAVSRTGAAGLMQFMPATAAWAETVNHWGAVDALNPLWSIRAGVWYDRWLFERVRGDTECDRWHFVLSSYNGGLGYVYKRQAKSDAPGQWAVTGFINPGILPSNQVENQTYSPKILLRHQKKFTTWGKTTCLD